MMLKPTKPPGHASSRLRPKTGSVTRYADPVAPASKPNVAPARHNPGASQPYEPAEPVIKRPAHVALPVAEAPSATVSATYEKGVENQGRYLKDSYQRPVRTSGGAKIAIKSRSFGRA